MTKRSETSAAIDRFIDRYGMALEGGGMSRTASRMVALLTVYGGPFSFSELTQRLGVSRGSVSTNTRFLEHLGFVERVARPGDRQDYFQITANPGLRYIECWLDREIKKERLIDELLTDGDLGAEARRRIQGMLTFMQATNSSAREMIARLGEK